MAISNDAATTFVKEAMSTSRSASRSTAPAPGQTLPPAVLPAAAARRVSNQIARAFHGTYGATTGLQTIVRAIARQLLVAGSTPDEVTRAFEACVLAHPARHGGDSRSAVPGQVPSAMLVEITRECVSSVALEYEHSSRRVS